MKSDIKAILQALPQKVAWEDVVHKQYLDERVAAMNYLYGDIIGVIEGFVEWCPNNDPPTEMETFAWSWIIRPDLSVAIMDALLDEEFREIATNYIVEKYSVLG
jgi:hypothetical protein